MIDKAPVRRSSLAAVTGDTHNRMRAAEAAQTMPYIVVDARYFWEADALINDLSTDIATVFNFQQDGEDYIDLSVETTDASILRIYSGAGGGIEVLGGGLFYWRFAIEVTNAMLNPLVTPVFAQAGAYWSTGPNDFYDTDGESNEALVNVGPATYQPNGNGVMMLGGGADDAVSFTTILADGTRSTTGRETTIANQTQERGLSMGLNAFATKGYEFASNPDYLPDPAYQLGIHIKAVVARWTPVGFSDQTPEI